MSRRFFALIAVLIITCYVLPSFASAQVVYINPSKVESPEVGAKLEITVQVKEIKDLFGIQFNLLFDPTALKYDEKGTKKGNFPDPKKYQAFFIPPTLADGTLKNAALTMLGGKEGADCGTGAECILAYFRFEVLKMKASKIKLDAMKALSAITDDAGSPQTINVTLEHCSVTTSEPITSVYPRGKLPITWGRIKHRILNLTN